MKTNILATAAGLSDQDLLARLDVLAGRERYRGRPGLPAIPGDPRPARLGRGDAHRRAAAGAAPHTGESPGRPRESQRSEPPADRRAGGRAGSSRPRRVRSSRWTEMLGADVSGVPPHSTPWETGAGHRGEHLAALLAPQPIRGRANLRASRASIARRGAASSSVNSPEAGPSAAPALLPRSLVIPVRSLRPLRVPLRPLRQSTPRTFTSPASTRTASVGCRLRSS